jgi:hypothetical protein
VYPSNIGQDKQIQSGGKKMVQISVDKIVKQTDKAVAVYFERRFIWLPKSQVVIRKLADHIEVDIPDHIWDHNKEQYSSKVGGLKCIS